MRKIQVAVLSSSINLSNENNGQELSPPYYVHYNEVAFRTFLINAAFQNMLSLLNVIHEQEFSHSKIHDVLKAVIAVALNVLFTTFA